MTSAMPVQSSTNWANKPSGRWSLCEFVIYPQKIKNTSEYMKFHIFVLQRMLRRYHWSSQFYETASELRWSIMSSYHIPQFKYMKFHIHFYYISKLLRALWFVNLAVRTLLHGALKFKAFLLLNCCVIYVAKFSQLIEQIKFENFLLL